MINKFSGPQFKYASYYYTNPTSFDCQDHVKFISINYSCLLDTDEASSSVPLLYPIENNFSRYLLKIKAEYDNIDLAMEQSLRDKKVTLKILKHKIFRGRFVGIYKYEEIKGTMESAVQAHELEPYDKYAYMLKLANIVNVILDKRNPKTFLLDLNLHPVNIVLLKGAPYKVRLVNLFPGSLTQAKFFEIKNEHYDLDFIDAKKRNVLLLGKLFFFMCFGKFFESFRDLENSLTELNENYASKGKTNYDPELMSLIRMMLNDSPADRPKLEVVLETLEQIKSNNTFHIQWVLDFFFTKFYKMKNEIKLEYMSRKEIDEDDLDQDNFTEMDFYSRVVNLKERIYKKFKKSEHSQVILKHFSQLTTKDIKAVYDKYMNFDIYSFLNENDTFKMLNDIKKSDYILSSPNKRELQETRNLIDKGYFIHDLLDSIYIAHVSLKKNFHSYRSVTAFKDEEGNLCFTDEKYNESLNSIKVKVRLLFMYYMYKDLHMLQQNSLFWKKNPFLLLKVSEKLKNGASNKFFTKSNLGIICVFFLTQMMILLFTSTLFLRRSKYTKHSKESFPSRIKY